MRHEEYLREHRYLTYMNLLTTGKLNDYLTDVEEQARDMVDRLIAQMSAADEITEQMKAKNQMAWVQRMNGILHRAKEIVMRELICV